MGSLSDKEEHERLKRNFERRNKSVREDVSLGDLHINEDFWGPGSGPIVKEWLARNYRHGVMPRLVAARDSQGVTSLIGWDHDNTQWPSLLSLIFGQEYADKRLELNEMGIRLGELLEEGHGEYGAAPDGKEDQ